MVVSNVRGPFLALPNFILVGAPKSGTSSLYQYLKQHPDVFMCEPKEPYFFVPAEEKEKWFALGLKPVIGDENYAALFDGRTSEKAVGEASAPYLFTAKTPELISKRIPDVKLVAVLRNPIERAYSQYNFLFRMGMERLESFEAALAEEERRFQNGAPQFLFYRRRGLYAQQLVRYFERFDQSKMRIYLHEDLDRDAVSITQDVFRFLEVDDSFAPDVSQRHNPTLVEQKGFADVLLSGIKKRAIKSADDGASQTDMGIGSIRPWTEPKGKLIKPARLNKTTRESLSQYFQEDVRKLEKLIGRNLDHWLSN